MSLKVFLKSYDVAGWAPKIVHIFLESYAFSGKTIVPFCTSSSGINGSIAWFQTLIPSGKWLSGQCFSMTMPQAA